MIEIRPIDAASKADISLPNEPFAIFGRMIPSYVNEVWRYTTEEFAAVTEMTFPDEHYDFEEMSRNSVFLGAYEAGKCIGLAILQHHFLKHMYLYDLKVSRAHRGRGAGKQLLEAAEGVAREKGYYGLYTVGQDNNLAACLFYLRCGFDIGGFDNRVYGGTSQAGKADILFYKTL